LGKISQQQIERDKAQQCKKKESTRAKVKKRKRAANQAHIECPFSISGRSDKKKKEREVRHGKRELEKDEPTTSQVWRGNKREEPKTGKMIYGRAEKRTDWCKKTGDSPKKKNAKNCRFVRPLRKVRPPRASCTEIRGLLLLLERGSRKLGSGEEGGGD